jgi:hypothetical protein
MEIEKKRKIEEVHQVVRERKFHLKKQNGVSVITFDSSVIVAPHFFIDYHNTYDTIVRWIFHLNKQQAPPNPHLVIDGLVKMGKTTVLTTLVPLLLEEHQPDAFLTCYIDFLDYSSVSVEAFLGRFYEDLHSFALQHGIKTITQISSSVTNIQVSNATKYHEMHARLNVHLDTNFTTS